jgi:dipeptidase
VYQEIQEVRAVSTVCVIRQDWDHISRGLAEIAMHEHGWPADGSKVDFAGSFGDCPVGQASGLRRWGRATFLLEQQNGHIDVGFLRRLLGDHYEGTHFEVDPLAREEGPTPLCQHGLRPGSAVSASSWVFQAGAAGERLPIVWTAFGPPCSAVYFPLLLEGDIPPSFTIGGRESSADSFWWRWFWLLQRLHSDPKQLFEARDWFGRLQSAWDLEAEEMAQEGAALRQRGEVAALADLAGAFMQRTLEQFDDALGEVMAWSGSSVR